MTGPPPTPFAGGRGVRAALAKAATVFAASSQTPRLDAELLMAHALGMSREKLLLNHLDAAVPEAFAALVARRLAHEPIAYITGSRAFWTIDLAVGPGALVPRADSETLIEAAVAHFGDRAPSRILDLGTGPGTLLLAALSQWPGANGLGIDASDKALGYAAINARNLEMGDRVSFRFGNWAKGLEGEFDLILANPPYIATGDTLPAEVRDHEPAGALFAGADGLDDYRIIAPQLPALLAPDGVACIEVGAGQAAAVAELLGAQGLATGIRSDLGGIERCVTARLS
nr:peptide chain release factor N(5)-glutamine methyltransferase [Sphingomonas alpina]